MREFTLHCANLRDGRAARIGNEKNTVFPTSLTVRDISTFRTAVENDAMFSRMKGKVRNADNFEDCDCIVMDVDNGGSEIPEDWLNYSQMVEQIESMTSKEIAFYAVPSRNHMKQKGDHAPREKWHFFFPLSNKTEDAQRVSLLLYALTTLFPFADEKVKSPANAVFGTPLENVYSAAKHDGTEYIDTYLDRWLDDHPRVQSEIRKQPLPAAEKTSTQGESILEGSRNSTMTVVGSEIIKRHGDTPKARRMFDAVNAQRCVPPLGQRELDAIWKGREKWFYNTILTDPAYQPPEEFDKSLTIQQLPTLQPDNFTDLDQARVMIQRYQDTFGFVTEMKSWLHWAGCRWEFSDLGVQYLAQRLTDDQLIECGKNKEHFEQVIGNATAAGEKAIATDYEAKLKRNTEWFKFILKQRTSRASFNVLQTAAPSVQIPIDLLDADGYLLNTPDGTIDLRTGDMHPHDRSDHCTQMTTVSPSDEGKKTWSDFLNVITCDDADLARYLQEVCGRIAIGEVLEEGMIIAYGSGRNGKSTFFNTIARVLGDYSTTINAGVLVEQDPAKNRFATSVLRGKRFALAAELADSTLLNDATVKSLTSTDRVHGEKKHKDEFEFTPTHTLALFTNYLPKVKSTDVGIWRRLVVVPFNAVIQPSDVKLDFAKHLYNTCGGYILKWIVAGAREVLKNRGKIRKPTCVEDAISAYQADSDWLREFIAERCILDNGEAIPDNGNARYSITKGELYNVYKVFADSAQGFTRRKKEFDRLLQERMGEWQIVDYIDSHSKKACWRGITTRRWDEI